MSGIRLAALAAVVGALGAPVVAQSVSKPSSASARPQVQVAGESLLVTPLFSANGPVHGDRFGASIAALPDLDGDGLAELLVGAPNRQPVGFGTKGHVFVLSGADGAVLRVHDGWNKGDRLGHSVAALPDLDGDGVGDYGGGAIWAINVQDPDGPAAPGLTALWSGASGAPLPVVNGVGKWECFGAALGGMGDLDGDGLGDLLVSARFGGAPGGDAQGAPGHVRLMSGATGQTLSQVVGGNPGDWLGWAAVPLADLNGDGLTDVAAGAWAWPANQRQGQVQILSGADGSLLGSFQGHEHGEGFGYALAAMPDLDGDGLADLAVASPFAGDGQGLVTIVSPASGQTLFTLQGQAKGEQFGLGLVAIGDRDGDGLTELAVGAPFSAATGQVRIVSPASGKVLGTVLGHVPGSNFGEALCAVPDLTGDGLDELAIGAPKTPAGLAYGRVLVVSLH